MVTFSPVRTLRTPPVGTQVIVAGSTAVVGTPPVRYVNGSIVEVHAYSASTGPMPRKNVCEHRHGTGPVLGATMRSQT